MTTPPFGHPSKGGETQTTTLADFAINFANFAVKNQFNNTYNLRLCAFASKMNILTQKFQTKHDTAPFSKIKNEDFLPAFQNGITSARAEIDAIVNNSEAPTFENTIEALAFSGDTLDRISNIFFNLHSAETNDELQQIAQEVSPLLSEFSNDIRLNAKLFAKVKAIYEQKDNLNLTPEQTTLLDKNYKSKRKKLKYNQVCKLNIKEFRGIY